MTDTPIAEDTSSAPKIIPSDLFRIIVGLSTCLTVFLTLTYGLQLENLIGSKDYWAVTSELGASIHLLTMYFGIVGWVLLPSHLDGEKFKPLQLFSGVFKNLLKRSAIVPVLILLSTVIMHSPVIISHFNTDNFTGLYLALNFLALLFICCLVTLIIYSVLFHFPVKHLFWKEDEDSLVSDSI